MKKSEQEAIRRALAHHETTGVIAYLSPPYVGRPRWHIKLTQSPDYYDLTWREARVLCWVLAATEQSRTP